MESGLRELKERGYMLEASRRHRHPTTSSSGADDLLPPFSPPTLPHVTGPAAASLVIQVCMPMC